MNYNELQWITMSNNELQWVTMNYNELQWVTMNYDVVSEEMVFKANAGYFNEC